MTDDLTYRVPLTRLSAAEPAPSGWLTARVEAARAWVDSLTPEAREAHFAAQRKAWVAAEMAAGDEGTRVG